MHRSPEFFEQLPANISLFASLCSPRYYNAVIKPKTVSLASRKWHGLIWKPISIDEMHRFLGVLLRISLTPVDGGGYGAYFRDSNMTIQLSSGSSNNNIEIPDSRGFVSMLAKEFRLSLNRFKQIRGAFHPEDKVLGNGQEDKCYQLRHGMNELNKASISNFVPEANCAFDEGGIACRSWYCPVWQYNKDKPDKFRVDFFILARSKTYLIYHIDVYQGKNSANIGIYPPAANLPTTMKAVVNAIVTSDLKNGSNDVNGYRVVSLDNRYQCPQLAYLLWHR
jgi:Transposase IS4